MWPGSSMILKSWYANYLRSMGIFVWFFDLLVIIVLFFPKNLP